MLEAYWKGLVIVLLVFPLFTMVYDRAAFKEENAIKHLVVIMVGYPIFLPILAGMRVKRFFQVS